MLKPLNKHFAPKSVMPEKVIQFGEGNFLRAFVDWIIWNMDQKTNFNGSVVVVQPIEKGMVDCLNGQDCLYHVNLQGRENGKPVNTLERIDVISRALNPYTQNDAFMALADQPEIRFVISNTTEAGIAFDPACQLDDKPASSYPGKLVQLLYRRWQTFNGDPTKGLIIFPQMVLHFDVGRPKSVAALEQSMAANQKLFLVAGIPLRWDEVKSITFNNCANPYLVPEYQVIIATTKKGFESMHLSAGQDISWAQGIAVAMEKYVHP